MRIIKFLILSVLSVATAPAWAVMGDDYLAPCDKIVLGGDLDWVPYVIANEQGVSGVGMDLATKVFSELDIPIKYVAFNDHLEIMQALRGGDFDLLVSTYPNSDIQPTTVLVEPAYIIDPITVAVKIGDLPNVTSWESLSGMHGVMDMGFTPDQATEDFFDVYLSMRDKLTLSDALQAVISGKAYYIIGSELQLRYAIAKNNLQSILAIATGVRRAVPVHMAFRKNSPCQQYAAFLTKRLQDFKTDGTLQSLVNLYEISK